MNEYRILYTDLYNIDETGFKIDVGKAYKVVTRHNASERLYLPDSDNREQ